MTPRDSLTDHGRSVGRSVIRDEQRAIEKYHRAEYYRLRSDGRFAFTRALLTKASKRS